MGQSSIMETNFFDSLLDSNNLAKLIKFCILILKLSYQQLPVTLMAKIFCHHLPVFSAPVFFCFVVG